MNGREIVKKGLDYMKKPVIRREYIRTSAYPGFESMYKNKTVLVTGGTRGIGLASVKKFLKAGAEVIVTGRSYDRLKQVEDALGSKKLHGLEWDVADIEQQDKKIEEIYKCWGEIDILVNNAGANRNALGKSAGSWDEVSQQEWDYIMGTNLRAMYFLIQKFSSRWLREDAVVDKHIVNISSSSGFEPAVLPYGISKWGVVALTQGFGRKLAPNGIIVNGVAPGPVATTMAGKQEDTDQLQYHEIPSQRYCVAEEIADAVLFLASDYGRNIVGEILKVDGGLSLTVGGGQ